MRRSKVILFTILILFIGGFAFTVSGCGKSQDKGKIGKARDVYYCPMHPTYTSDRPGDCPICNKKFVKKEAEREKPIKNDGHKGHEIAAQGAPAEEKTFEEVCIEHSCTMNNCPMLVKVTIKPGERVLCPVCGEVISTTSGKVVEIGKKPAAGPTGPTVMISPEKQQLIGVTTGPVGRRELEKTIRASGRIAYDPELVVTQEEFIQAINNEEKIKDSPLQYVIDRAKSLTSAARQKLRLLGMSEEQILSLEKTRKSETTLYLPGKGESVWAYISIYEYEIGLISIGQPVEIEAVAYPRDVFKGTVMAINPVLDPMTRTNQARVEVKNEENKLKPEMFVKARIKISLGEKLAVPETAILDTGIRKIVYVSRENGMLESRDIKTGLKVDGYYEVLEGLDEGDIVVTSGNFLIDSESRLKSAAAGEAGHKQHGQ